MGWKMQSITHLLQLPSICALCSHPHQKFSTLCRDCRTLLKPLEFACRHCALPLPDNRFHLCGQCIKNKPFFDSVTAPYHFEEPLRTLLHQFKYNEKLHLARFLVELMLHRMPEHIAQTQCLIPVPLHNKRLRARGFNQAAELARLLGKQLKIPCKKTICFKKKHTLSQAGLGSKERRQNLRNVFSVKNIPYRHVMLIDDLLTTGSTANELARALKQKGVQSVSVWCCARTSA